MAQVDDKEYAPTISLAATVRATYHIQNDKVCIMASRPIFNVLYLTLLDSFHIQLCTKYVAMKRVLLQWNCISLQCIAINAASCRKHFSKRSCVGGGVGWGHQLGYIVWRGGDNYSILQRSLVRQPCTSRWGKDTETTVTWMQINKSLDKSFQPHEGIATDPLVCGEFVGKNIYKIPAPPMCMCTGLKIPL